MLGTVGQLLILVAFVACGLSGFAFFQATQTRALEWKRIGRAAWGVVVVALLIAAGILLYLLVTHQFQYAYVYGNTSLDLPLSFLVSSFWAGQEGSFLLWIVLTALVGLALLRYGRSFETAVMTIVAFCQFFLISMVVGLKVGTLTIGASPFTKLVEKFPDAPMLQVPGFVPADGAGLNDLLQNYWMAIHPPTLFVGFALMIVPFAFAVAALWKRRYTDWVRPALPWTLAGTMVLGFGIALGGYWAYETLSFGGYWAWDPVENSSLVPWIIGIAAVHSMIIQKKSGRGHKSALFLSIIAYLLVIYSTFLTRSGILGDVSVHSFVDLGMMNQLLLWILVMGGVGLGLFALRYRELPTPRQEPRMLSREFMIFSGALLLVATAAVVLVGTSSPILGRLFRDSPSTVPISFYNTWTLPLAVGFVFLAGLGQLFWWNKMSVENVNRVLLKPIALSVASTVVVLIFSPFVEHTANLAALQAPQPIVEAGLMSGVSGFWTVYGEGVLLLLLLFAGFFALYGNGLVLWRVGRGNPRLAGGALSHVGFALLVLGVIASGAFSNPLASSTGVQIGNSRDNFVLNRNETREVGGYRVSYSGQERTAEGRPVFLIDFVDPRGRSFTLKPVVYKSNSDQWIQHPDHRIYAEKDIYVAVTPSAMFESGQSEGEAGELQLARGDSTVVGNQEYAFRFVDFDVRVDETLLPDFTEIAVAAVLSVTNLQTRETRELRPIYLIMEDRSQQFIQNRVSDWGITVTFAGMDVESGRINLILEGVDVVPEDWVVVQAYEKPFISFLWLGIILLTVGFAVSAFRRAGEAGSGRR